MKLGNIAKVAGTIKDIASADNPAEKAGALAAGAAAVAHPIVGTLAAPMIKKGVATAVQKGIDTAHDPKVQAKARGIVNGAGERGRAAIDGLSSRLQEFRS